ncbi:MAG: SgcJ/EcaC family oxidoreductase [Planctomycetota bacterium]|nr:MAG: SgcJ/EcaC family oxidoreductase [Planctomycetota bacterium]REJ92544.1 MAG: SgcJ/EcaC family oxidoreductase [Planctomycetota bacterium]REK24102.1 MAG: SgcJ/EcaC family oxidoreductase [Planctomycetota bacterium]REK38320.1 MAG: SgcJ/EcaC family oxidoreductase [Planctomycetota bacterium]
MRKLTILLLCLSASLLGAVLGDAAFNDGVAMRADLPAGTACELVGGTRASCPAPPTTAVAAIADDESEAEERFEIPDEEKPFWDSAAAFLEAYRSGDAAAIGEMFTEDAEVLDEFGERTVGRDAIVAMFQNVFDHSPDALIEEIQILSVRRISDTVALEEGIVVSSESADAPRFTSKYAALHLKGGDGKWRINTLKDFPREHASRQEQLRQLEWLLGDWVNQDDDTVVHTSCNWSEDGNYLLREFTVQTYEGLEMNGVQRIGWDASRKKLRSWTFDSEGGFFTGLWTRQDDQWIVTSAGVTADGETTTGTAVYTVVDEEMIIWQHQGLIVGDEMRESSDPVTMVRLPPQPNED